MDVDLFRSYVLFFFLFLTVSWINTYLIVWDTPTQGMPAQEMPALDFPMQAFPALGLPALVHLTLLRRSLKLALRLLGLLIDGVDGAFQLPLRVAGAGAHDITGLLQLPHGFPDGVHALLVDGGQAVQGVIPAIRQGKHDGQQPLGFKRKTSVLEMVVAHDGIILCLGYAKNSHMIQPSFLQ